MIVVVGGIKGGTGKTTIATNLAVIRAANNKKVLLVDGDDQKSASQWASQRDAMGIETSWTTVAFNGITLMKRVLQMKKDYDDVIIDVGGRETQSLRSAIAVADIFLIPFKPRSLDIWTLGSVRVVINEMMPANPKFKSYALINQADYKGSDNEDSLNILKECEEIKTVPFNVASRKVFANAASEGLGIIEVKNQDKKAIAEMMDLYNFIYDRSH